MIEIRGVRKSFGSLRVIESTDLAIEDGSSVAIVGPSGSGKTTLLRILGLMITPDEGRVAVDNDVVADSNREFIARTKISYSFQEPLLLPYLTVIENLTFIPRCLGDVGSDPHDSIEVLLSRVGLRDKIRYYPPSLSEGEKKRVDIVRAFARRATILIADEPLSNLDGSARESVMGLLDEHRRQGGSLVYSCLDESEARFATSRYTIRSLKDMPRVS